MSNLIVGNIKGALKLKKKPNDKKCDFTIQVGDDSIKVHRSKLRKATTYFDEKYQPRFDNLGNVCLEHAASFETVKICVDFFYKRQVIPNMENLGDLLMLCRKWRVKGLETICDDYILRQINPDSCVQMKRLAQSIGDFNIEKTVDNYILVHLDKVATGGAVGEFTEDELTAIFTDYIGPVDEFGVPDLKKRDAILWQILTIWVKFSEEDRIPLFCGFVEKIPFSFFDAVLIEKVILKEPIIRNCDHCFKYITDGLLDVLEHRVEFSKTLDDFRLEEQFCTPEESLFLLSFAQKHGREEVASKVKDCMRDNFDEIIIHSAFGDLSKDELAQYLNTVDSGRGSDIQSWNAIITWVKCGSERKADFLELFKMIELENLPLDFLKRNVIPEQLVRDSRECTNLVMEALLQHAIKQ